MNNEPGRYVSRSKVIVQRMLMFNLYTFFKDEMKILANNNISGKH